MGKKEGPKGPVSSYAYFVKTCREEHKKKYPDDSVDFKEFNSKCSIKWKDMNELEKKRFEDMARLDRDRYNQEMLSYKPTETTKKTKKRKKDPNAPKRPMTAFFYFAGDVRGQVKKENPGMPVTEISKELGRLWEKCLEKPKYEAMAVKDRERYEKAMTAYRAGETFVDGAAKKVKPAQESDHSDSDSD